jgi:hypothetical protein
MMFYFNIYNSNKKQLVYFITNLQNLNKKSVKLLLINQDSLQLIISP